MGIWRERRDVHNSIFVVDKLAPCIINGLPVQGDFPDRGNVCEADKGVPACGAGAARECATGGLSTDSWHFFTFSCNNPSTAVRRSPAPYTGAAENCAHFYQLLSRESTSGPPSTGNSLPLISSSRTAYRSERHSKGISFLSHSVAPPLSQKVQLRSHFLRGWAS